MNETTFLTVDYLKEITPISSALGDQTSLLLPFISVAESMHINDVLGIALKDDLLSKIENNSLTGDSLTLVENFIIPTSAWYTFFEASTFIIYRAESRGITKKYSDNSQALDRQEFANFRQSILDKAVFYKSALVAYLEANKSKYPLYRSDCGVIKTGNSSGIYLG